MNNNELKDVVRDFLNAHRKAIFAFINDSNAPTTSLMLYAIDDDLNVFFGTRRAFGKYADATRNPIVALSVVEEALDPLKVVDIRGTVQELDESEGKEAYDFFKSKNPSKYYVEGAEDFVMFRISPTFVRLADATSGELTLTNVSVTK